jgi:hypothetical protein
MSTKAPMNTRPNPTCEGVKARSARLMNRKLEPQATAATMREGNQALMGASVFTKQ